MNPLQIAGTEWIWIILVIAVLLFGSKKIPELARAVGKAMGEFQRGRAEFERELREAQATLDVNRPLPPPQEPLAPVTPEQPPIAAPQEPAIPATAQQAPPSASTPEREKLEKAAKDLGIDPAGKTDQQLKEEIHKVLMQ